MNVTDALNMTTPAEATEAAFAMLDLGQRWKPNVLISAAAVFLLAICARFKTDPRAALARAERMVKDAANDPDRSKYVRLRALEDFMNKEMG